MNNYFQQDKFNALKKIDLSISKWKDHSSKNYFVKQLSTFDKNLNWQIVKRFSKFYNVHVIWCNKIVRSQEYVKEQDIIIALKGIKRFYEKISTIKPDLSHPDIFKCLSISTNKSGLKLKNLFFKENIEIDILDPFDDVLGKYNKKIVNILNLQKNEVLKDLEYSLKFFDNLNNKHTNDTREFIKLPKNFQSQSNKFYYLKLIWFGKEITEKKTTKDKVKIELLSYINLINAFNVKRPNLNNKLIEHMYKIAVEIVKKKKSIYFFN